MVADKKKKEKRGRHEVGQVAYMKMDMVAEININSDIDMEIRLVRELVTGVG